jgi:hypothetical protein
MRGVLALCLPVGMAVSLSISPALAQSGVLSGPPQVPPGVRGPNPSFPVTPGTGPGAPGPAYPPGPGLGPDYRPGSGAGDRPLAGARPEPAPGAGSATGASPRPQPAATWIAVVGGFARDGKRVSVGYSGHQPSQAAAESAAIKACLRSEPSVSCLGPYAVSNGCLYIVPGNRRDGGVRWGRGGTRQAAFDQCRRGGYTCPDAKVIGGCVPGSN